MTDVADDICDLTGISDIIVFIETDEDNDTRIFVITADVNDHVAMTVNKTAASCKQQS